MTSEHFDPDGVVHQKGRHGEAFNAEPSISKLTDQVITSQDTLYRRNHGDIVYQPELPDGQVEKAWHLDLMVDWDVAEELDWQAWKSNLPKKGLNSHEDIISSSKNLSLSIDQLRESVREHRVVAAMECAGNRRKEMSERAISTAEGLQWNAGTISNALWQGASVRDVLLKHGVPDPYGHLEDLSAMAPTAKSIDHESAQWSRSLYLHFISSQPAPDSKVPGGQKFGSSITLSTAMHPNQDVLLSWGVNEESLDSAHGYPLRAVIPGHVAARWTKWLSHLRISNLENDSPPMVDDYKLLIPPEGASEEEHKKWVKKMQDQKARDKELSKAAPIMRLGVGSGVSVPVDDDRVVVKDGKIYVEGYAVGTEGSPVVQVEVLLLPDTFTGASSSFDAQCIESLRATAQSAPASSWYTTQFDSTNTRSVYPKRRQPVSQKPKPEGGEVEIADMDSLEGLSKFSWSWTLWRAWLPVPEEALQKTQEAKWAIVVRATTESGIQQQVQSPWNLRGFKERSWPIVGGLTLVPRS